LIVGLVYDLLIGVPLALTKEILTKLRDEIDKERLITEESIKERLQQLQLLLLPHRLQWQGLLPGQQR